MTQASVVKTPGKIFVVGVAGVGLQGLKVLERIFDITRYRQRRYQLVGIDLNNEQQAHKDLMRSDIRIINVSDPQAVIFWKRFSINLTADQKKPVLQLNASAAALKDVNKEPSELHIPWPVNPARLLQALDNYTIRYLDYYPEFEIGAEAAPSSSDVKNIQSYATPINTPTLAQNLVQNARILVADDSLAVRRQLKLEFDSMNASLDLVADGDDAVQAAEAQAYDLIFLDVVMPKMDGYAACKAIRRTALNKNTPVIMLTSRSSRFDKLKGVLAGCDTYLTKPVNHNEFKAVTKKHLADRAQEAARKSQ